MNNVKLNCSLNKPELVVSQNPNAVYLLVEIEAAGKGNLNNAIPLNIGMVIDKSGSMYDDGKLDNVILAMKHVIDLLSPKDYFSVTAFADRAEIIQESRNIRDKQEVKNAMDKLDDIEIGYRTYLSAGLEAAIQQVKKNFNKNGINKIFLLTDGEVDNESESRHIIEKEKDSGISFTTIGVGQEFNEEFLISIARETGANSHYIENPNDIPNIFSAELQNLKNAALNDCVLKIKTSDNIQIKQLAKAEPEIALFTGNDTVKFDSLYPDKKQSVLIELVVYPEETGKYTLAEIELYSSGSLLAAETVFYQVSTGEIFTKRLSPAFTQALDKVNNFIIQTKALDKLKSGDTVCATKMFTSILGKKINNSQKMDTLLTRAIDQIKTTQRLDPLMTKQLTYQLKK